MTSTELAKHLGDGAQTVEWNLRCDCGGMIDDPLACWGCWIPCQWQRPQMMQAAAVYLAIRHGERVCQGKYGPDHGGYSPGYLAVDCAHESTRLALALGGWVRVPRIASERWVFAFGEILGLPIGPWPA